MGLMLSKPVGRSFLNNPAVRHKPAVFGINIGSRRSASVYNARFGGRTMGLAKCLAMWLHTTKVNLRVPEEKPFFSAHPSTNIPSRLQSRLFLITVIPGSQCQRLFWAPLEEVIDLIKNMAQTSRKLTPQQMKALPYVLPLRVVHIVRIHPGSVVSSFQRTATLFHFRILYSASSWSLSSLTQSTYLGGHYRL